MSDLIFAVLIFVPGFILWLSMNKVRCRACKKIKMSWQVISGHTGSGIYYVCKDPLKCEDSIYRVIAIEQRKACGR